MRTSPSVGIAWMRAARSLMRPDIFWHLLWPTLIAFLVWIIVAVLVWSEAANLLLHFVQTWPWVGSGFVEGSAQAAFVIGFAHIMLLLLFVPLTLLTAALLISVLALPLMLDRVAATDYPDLVERRGGSQIGSVVNTLWALLLFVIVGVATLPLWLIPGVGLAMSVALSAWLNQRCYRYDALMRHADREELKRLPQAQRGGLYVIGGIAGVLVFVPIFNFLVPALSGLAFVHYLLQALRESRAGGVVGDVVIGPRI